MLFTLIALMLSVTAHGATDEEERIDKQLGILDRPWKIFLPDTMTLYYLRSQATTLTGLPALSQQPQGSLIFPPLVINEPQLPPSSESTSSSPVTSPGNAPSSTTPSPGTSSGGSGSSFSPPPFTQQPQWPWYDLIYPAQETEGTGGTGGNIQGTR
ncbi:MAG: hypothetical protein KJ630_07835 [Proteobacteria bacterium]|nr:hypothetical protein [Pseudomonadota bacterium]